MQTLLPIQYVELATQGGKYDSEDLTVSFVACNETPFLRYDWWTGQRYNLILSHDPTHVDLSRVTEGGGTCMFLEDHYPSSEYEIGKVKSATITNKELQVTCKINNSEDNPPGRRYKSKLDADCEPGKSVGVSIGKLQVEKKAQYDVDEDGRRTLISPATLRAIEWSLQEISTVSKPAISVGGTSLAALSALPETERNKMVQDYTTSCMNVTLSGDISDYGTLFNLQGELMPTEQEVKNAGVLLENLPPKNETMKTDDAAMESQDDRLSKLEAEREMLLAEVKKSQQQYSELASSFAEQQISAEVERMQRQAETLWQNDRKLSKAEFDVLFGDENMAAMKDPSTGSLKRQLTQAHLNSVASRPVLLASDIAVDSPLENLSAEELKLQEADSKAVTDKESAWMR